MDESVEACARAAHEANRTLCESQGDKTQVPWDQTSEDNRQATRASVKEILANPSITAEDIHNKWMSEKARAGWRYGPKKDAEAKTHPSMVAFAQLPKSEQDKDHLFLAVVRKHGPPMPIKSAALDLDKLTNEVVHQLKARQLKVKVLGSVDPVPDHKLLDYAGSTLEIKTEGPQQRVYYAVVALAGQYGAIGVYSDRRLLHNLDRMLYTRAMSSEMAKDIQGIIEYEVDS